MKKVYNTCNFDQTTRTERAAVATHYAVGDVGTVAPPVWTILQTKLRKMELFIIKPNNINYYINNFIRIS